MSSNPAAPAVSIVVPVFGTEEYLADCLDSLLGQTLDDIELIVVDDHSPGDVESVVTRVAGDDERVRLVRHDANKGPLQARLTGARLARAEYLTFVDSDDTVEQWHIEMLHSAAIRHDADLVTCALTVVDMGGTNLLKNRGGDERVMSGDDVMHSLLVGRMLNHMGTKLIRKATWRSSMSRLDDRWTTISFAEDLLLTFLTVQEATRHAHIPDAGYRYIRRADSITTSPGVDKVIGRLNDHARVYDALCSFLIERPMPPEHTTAFFEREFAVVVDDLLGELTTHDTRASGLVPLASFDLLDAVVTGRSSPWDPPAAPRPSSSDDTKKPAGLRAQREVDRAQFVLLAAGVAVASLEPAHEPDPLGMDQHVADGERRLAELEVALAARDAEIAELERWREAVERSRVYRTLLALTAVDDLPIIGSTLRQLRHVMSGILRSRPRLGRR